MTSVTQVEQYLKEIMEERACVLARDTGCIQRERKFDGADLLQTLVFGWLTHPDASLEQLASMAEVRDVSVSDSAIHKRFTPECAEFVHCVLQEMTAVVVQADHEVPLPLLKRFSAVILEDASTITLPDELAEVWRGCGGKKPPHQGRPQAAHPLGTATGASPGACAQRWASLRAHQSVCGGSCGGRESVCGRFGLLQPAS